MDAVRERADALRREGQTVMFVAVDAQLAGLVAVADPIKTTTPDAIRALHDAGLKVVMTWSAGFAAGSRFVGKPAAATSAAHDDVFSAVLVATDGS